MRSTSKMMTMALGLALALSGAGFAQTNTTSTTTTEKPDGQKSRYHQYQRSIETNEYPPRPQTRAVSPAPVRQPSIATGRRRPPRPTKTRVQSGKRPAICRALACVSLLLALADGCTPSSRLLRRCHPSSVVAGISPGITAPTPLDLFDTDGDRASQFRHTAQGPDRDFGSTTRIFATA